jgi:hypothetical protein
MRDCIVADNRTWGVALSGTAGTLERVLVRDTLPPTSTETMGIGIIVSVVSAGSPEVRVKGQLTLRDSVVQGSRPVGVGVIESSATIERSVIRQTRATPSSKWGDGVQVYESGAGLELSDSLVQGHARAGLLFVNSKGSVDRSVFSKSQFSIVRAQGAAPRIGDGNVYEDNIRDLPQDMELTPMPAPKLPEAGL